VETQAQQNLGATSARGHAWLAAFGGVFAARIATAGMGFLGTVLMARALGPGDFGQLAVLLAVSGVAAGLLGPALDASLVRFAARRLTPEHDGAAPYFRFLLLVKIAAAALIVAIGFVGARPIAGALSGRDGGAAYSPHGVFVAFLGASFLTLWCFAQSYFQAHRRFGAYAAFEFSGTALRLGIIVALLFAARAGIVSLLWAYAASALIMGAIAWSFLPRDYVRLERPRAAMGRDFFLFARWVIAAACFTTLAQRVDLFLLAAFRVPKETIGHYGAATSLAQIGDLAVMSLFNVLLPTASAIAAPAVMRAFLRRFRMPAAAACVALLPGIAAAGPVARLTFGPAYAETGTLFAVLLAAALASLIGAPSGAALYGLGRARAIAMLEGVKLVALTVAGLYVAPRYGALGMAWTVAIVKATIAVGTYLAAHREIDRLCAAEGMFERSAAP